MDEDLNPHEELLGLRIVQNLCADTIVVCICHVLIHTKLKLKNCRAQCCDSASNISREISGLITQIKTKEPRAIFTHCYEHPMQLAIGDMIKKIQNMKNTLDTTSEISKLLKY